MSSNSLIKVSELNNPHCRYTACQACIARAPFFLTRKNKSVYFLFLLAIICVLESKKKKKKKKSSTMIFGRKFISSTRWYSHLSVKMSGEKSWLLIFAVITVKFASSNGKNILPTDCPERCRCDLVRMAPTVSCIEIGIQSFPQNINEDVSVFFNCYTFSFIIKVEKKFVCSFDFQWEV